MKKPKRKKILVSVLSAVILTFVHLAEGQQPKKIPRIGVLAPGRSDLSFPILDAFKQNLRELGWVEGKNVVSEYRWGEGNENRLPDLAAELIHINVDIIVATTVRAGQAAQRLTRTIPIVVMGMTDPVGAGFVNSLGRPGGNVTGPSLMARNLDGKRLELLKEIIPQLSRVAVFSNLPNGAPAKKRPIKEIEVVARSLSLELQIVNVNKRHEIEPAFSSVVNGRIGALIVQPYSIFFRNRIRIVDLAAKSRLPAMYPSSEYVEAGGLMSYGSDRADLIRRIAILVDKVLKGAKPADLPVEQPTKFELVVNLNTAKNLGLTIPSEVLMWADEVIR